MMTAPLLTTFTAQVIQSRRRNDETRTTKKKPPRHTRMSRIKSAMTTPYRTTPLSFLLLLQCLLLLNCHRGQQRWTVEAWQPSPVSLSSSPSSLSFRSYSRIHQLQRHKKICSFKTRTSKCSYYYSSSSSSRLSVLPDFTILSDLIQATTTHFHHTAATSATANLDIVSSSISGVVSGGGGFWEAMTSSIATTTSHLVSSSSTTMLASSATATMDTAISMTTTNTNTDEAMIRLAGEAALAELGRDVLIFLAVSVVVVPLSQWLKVTPVLSFLAVGCLLGPNGLGVFANSEANLELGDFGILFLLFSEGLNLSPDRLGALRQFSAYGLVQIMASMMLFFFGILWGGPLVINYIAPVLQMDDFVVQIFSSPAEAFCIAAAGALSSSAFIFPVIKAKKWEDRPEGIAALSILLLQDVAVAPLLVILPIIAGAGPQSWTEVGILAAKATVGFGTVLVAGSYVIRYVFDVVAAARSTETFVAAALLVALGMGQVAEFLGLSATTGAFAAGVLLASNRYRAQIKADIRPFEGILLGIFFITAGAELDPNLVIHNLPILSIGIVTFIIIKALILFIAGPAMGKTWAGAARVAITLSGGGEFSLVLFKLAQQLEVLPARLADLLTASVIISMSLTPILANLADTAGNYIENNMGDRDVIDVSAYYGDGSAYYGEDGRPLLTPANAEVLFTRIDVDNSGTIEFTELQTALVERGLGYAAIAKVFEAFDKNNDGIISRDEWAKGLHDGLLQEALWVGRNAEVTAAGAGQTEVGGKLTNVAKDAIVICGFTEFGKEMYEVLEACGATANGGVVAFELNPSRVSAGIASNANIIYGDGASYVLLRSAGVSQPRAVIVAFRSEARRVEAISRLRGALPPDTPIYARVISGQAVGRKELIQAGATDVVSERTEAAIRFGSLVGAIGPAEVTGEFRKRLARLTKAATKADPAPQVIPGIPPDTLRDMAEEFGCSAADMKRLYEIFTSVPEMDGKYVDITQLRDVLLRTVNGGPIDDEQLAEWMESADKEGGGTLSFVDFARLYFRGIQKMEKKNAAVVALDLDEYREQGQ